MRKRQARVLFAFIALVVVLLGSSLAAGQQPQLGLDLKGGVSVVLRPTSETSEDTLNQAIEIIRNRIDSLGVAEPEITRQGSSILVQIPGVKDRDRAIELVGTTAELRFRPVLKDSCSTSGAIGNCVPDEGATLESMGIDPNPTTTTADPSAPTTTADPSATTTSQAATTTTEAATTTTEAATTTTDPSATTTTADPAAPTTTADPAAAPTTTVVQTDAERQADLEELVGINIMTTSREDDVADATVVLHARDDDGNLTLRYQLGPTGLTGKGISDANAQAPQVAGSSAGWTVSLDPKGGAEGRDQLNVLAAECFNRGPTCPTGLLGIVLDGEVVFAGTVQTPSFDESVQLSGTYSKSEAEDIATALRYGSLPIELEQQSVQTVSATLGNDAKNAGLLAGAIGLTVVALYILAYYRLLGAVALASLVLSFSLLWVVIAYVGETRGLALTLAGITGIIVSIGVSLDSNIVFFEHMKEDIRNGRTPRSASERSFKGAWSTVVKADVGSLLGAASLYFLTSGSVRGFAFYLGLATVLDLVATYFFLGPIVQIIGRTKHFEDNPNKYGLPAGPGNPVAVTSAGTAQ